MVNYEFGILNGKRSVGVTGCENCIECNEYLPFSEDID